MPTRPIQEIYQGLRPRRMEPPLDKLQWKWLIEKPRRILHGDRIITVHHEPMQFLGQSLDTIKTKEGEIIFTRLATFEWREYTGYSALPEGFPGQGVFIALTLYLTTKGGDKVVLCSDVFSALNGYSHIFSPGNEIRIDGSGSRLGVSVDSPVKTTVRLLYKESKCGLVDSYMEQITLPKVAPSVILRTNIR